MSWTCDSHRTANIHSTARRGDTFCNRRLAAPVVPSLLSGFPGLRPARRRALNGKERGLHCTAFPAVAFPLPECRRRDHRMGKRPVVRRHAIRERHAVFATNALSAKCTPNPRPDERNIAKHLFHVLFDNCVRQPRTSPPSAAERTNSPRGAGTGAAVLRFPLYKPATSGYSRP